MISREKISLRPFAIQQSEIEWKVLVLEPLPNSGMQACCIEPFHFDQDINKFQSIQLALYSDIRSLEVIQLNRDLIGNPGRRSMSYSSLNTLTSEQTRRGKLCVGMTRFRSVLLSYLDFILKRLGVAPSRRVASGNKRKKAPQPDNFPSWRKPERGSHCKSYGIRSNHICLQACPGFVNLGIVESFDRRQSAHPVGHFQPKRVGSRSGRSRRCARQKQSPFLHSHLPLVRSGRLERVFEGAHAPASSSSRCSRTRR